jgi:hypothetical protein
MYGGANKHLSLLGIVIIGWRDKTADREKTAKALDKREREQRKKGANH